MLARMARAPLTSGRSPTVAVSSTQKALRVPVARLRELVRFVARRRRVRLTYVEVEVVSARAIAALNRRYLSHRGATDVISFDLSDRDSVGLVGLIVVCADLAVREAPRHSQRPTHELMRYVIHGLLHLMGCKDKTPVDRQAMHEAETGLLEAFLARRRSR